MATPRHPSASDTPADIDADFIWGEGAFLALSPQGMAQFIAIRGQVHTGNHPNDVGDLEITAFFLLNLEQPFNAVVV